MMKLLDVAEEVGEFSDDGILFRFLTANKIGLIVSQGADPTDVVKARRFRDANVSAMKLLGHLKWIDPSLLKDIDFMKHRVERGDYGAAPGLRVIRPPKKRVKS